MLSEVKDRKTRKSEIFRKSLAHFENIFDLKETKQGLLLY